MSGPLEEAMLEPIRFADRQQVTLGFEGGHVRPLVARVGDLQDDVDDRFGGQPGDRRRAGVRDANDALAEHAPQPLFLAFVQGWPRVVVLVEVDPSSERRALPDVFDSVAHEGSSPGSSE